MPARAPLSVHLVLDRSGSMSGTAIENARQAAVALVEKMQPQDDFSMVTFSSSAELLAPDGPVGPRKDSIIAKIRAVQADGGTNISAGLDLGYAQAHSKSISPDAVKLVMLLSDGHANGGDTNVESLGQRSANATGTREPKQARPARQGRSAGDHVSRTSRRSRDADRSRAVLRARASCRRAGPR
jgi:Ca-activated chloride channel family protein